MSSFNHKMFDVRLLTCYFFFFQAEDGIRDVAVTGVQTCALPILYDLFAGGGFSRATVFALGIMPYISASIVFQLAAPVFPVVEKMQRDEEGRKTLTQWTRYLTVVLCLFQAYGYALFAEQLPGAVAHAGLGFR